MPVGRDGTLFFYGTLCYQPLLELVLAGQNYRASPATLAGHKVNWVQDQPFPMISEATDQDRAEGVLVQGLTQEALDRLNFYEGGFDYALKPISVLSEDGSAAEASVYFPEPGLWPTGAPWVLQDWIAAHGAMTLEAAREVMSLFGQVSASEIASRFGMIRTRAASAVRARGEVAPATLRASFGAGDLKVQAETQPYSRFFAMREQDLSFRRYDGAMSEVVNRAAFIGGDAVILLPYDPVRDRVLVIEQFRMGPHMRGDTRPWLLEPIAGRVDAGETPQDCAHREALEEAGLRLDHLIALPHHYPSPGGSTEYFYTYVALCDLLGDACGIGGVADEAEDIRSHVIAFSKLMELVNSGEVNCGPLLLCAYWLATQRDSLRKTS